MRPGYRRLKTILIKNLRLFFFDEDEIRELLEVIDSFHPEIKRDILALCVSFSNASAIIVPKILKHVEVASRHLTLKAMAGWIRNSFDLLDARGLEPAVSFITRTDRTSLRAFSEPKRLSLKDVQPTLQTYIAGISGMNLKIEGDSIVHTDGDAIYLPSSFKTSVDARDDLLLYKLAISYCWAQISLSTIQPPHQISRDQDDVSHLEAFLYTFEDRRLAIDLYVILEAFRLERFLEKHVPGLLKQEKHLNLELFKERKSIGSLNEKTSEVEALYQYFLGRDIKGPAPAKMDQWLGVLRRYRKRPLPDTTAFTDLYHEFHGLEGTYESVPVVPFLGTVEPSAVTRQLRNRKRRERKTLHSVIDKILKLQEEELKSRIRQWAERTPNNPPRVERRYLLIKGLYLELDEKTAALLEEEGAALPGTLVAGSSIGGGQSLIELKTLIEEMEEEPAETVAAGIKYDEWDFNRHGYRKRWCTLNELDVHPSAEPFVDLTLRNYGGYVTTLRKRFEALRTEPRVLKRQKEGDDIDLDAIIEAVSDLRAGLSPKENLFTNLERHERSIAVLFLLDMSGSTKGWINRSEKEALVLMCEALESLGDSYAIHGFSGMTRNRCDFYRIKAFGEPYSEDVKKRISGILPKDYTRMGPAIRHATNLLNSVEARTKLLITLSDGKPEDYDAYKGDYGIEDTRMALIEAKQQSVHPYCITIDRDASFYLPHMYGEVNYTFIDDVRKLPSRITDIYSRLTT